MKLVLISDTWDPDLNNIASGLWKLFDSIEDLGHNVFVVQPGMFENPFEYDGFRIVRNAKYTEFILRNLRFDAIHILTEGPLGNAARKYCLRHGISFTSTYNADIPLYLSSKFKIPQWLSKAYLKSFHAKSNKVYVHRKPAYEELLDSGVKRLVHVDWDLPNPPETGRFLKDLAFKFEVFQE